MAPYSNQSGGLLPGKSLDWDLCAGLIPAGGFGAIQGLIGLDQQVIQIDRRRWQQGGLSDATASGVEEAQYLGDHRGQSGNLEAGRGQWCPCADPSFGPDRR